MKDRVSGLSESAAILIGALMISLAILYVGGGLARLGVKAPAGQAAVPAAAQPTAPGAPTGPVDVSVGVLPVQGKEDAKVTVIEFSDFQCPFCGAVSGHQPNGPVTQQLTKQDPTWQPYVTGIMNDYVKTGKVKFAYRDFAFLGQESNDSANAARCANEQGKFWEFHDKLFSSQSGENQGAFAKDKLKQFGKEVGLDAAKFNDCVDQNKYAKDVQADTDAGRTAGVTGTPAVFVNGKQISGAVPYSTVKAEIEAALNQ